MLSGIERQYIYESFSTNATMNRTTTNGASFYYSHLALLLVCALCASTHLSAQTIIQTPEQADSLRRVIAAATHDTTRVRAMNELAWYLSEVKGDNAAALVQAHGAREIAERGNFRMGIAAALKNIGLVLFRQGKYVEALEYNLQSLRMFEELGDKKGIAGSLNNIANVYYSFGKYAEALQYFTQSLHIREKLGNKEAIAGSLSNIAIVYEALGNYPNALTYHFKSVQIDKELGNQSGIASSLNNIGSILNKQGKFDEAQPYLGQSLQLSTEFGFIGLLPETLNLLALSYRGQSKFDSALQFSSRSLVLADSLGEQLAIKEALNELAIIMDSLGRHKESLRYLQRSIAVKDSLINLENLNKTSQLKELYEAEKREQQIALQQSELSRKTIIQLILIGILVAAVGLAFWFRSLYQNKNRANAEILRQQQTLENQAMEIELANTTLHERNVLLEELDREKNEFLGIAAHDLKNPLASIRVTASMLQRYGGQVTPEKQHESLERILLVVERMMTIITNLLDINTLERRGIQFVIRNFDIAPLVEAAVQQYRAPAEAKQIALHLSIEMDSSVVLADEQSVTQVLDNLISNAVKYSPHGKNIFVRLKASNGGVRVEVQDEGQGISQDDRKKLFGKFARLTARPTGGEHSTGLGLSIVKKMVEAMNGTVWCESELGKGATFIVELPRY